ncbi:MAG TPA: heliorhodopsin HeR [Candidatus Saccharimonadales bacterium]|nr:heliorhodopsin HeR [Candidatus Saccharimonadales bacterium]
MALSTLKAKLQAAQNTITPQNLYNWNRLLAVVHAVQGIAILLLSTTKLFPVQTNYLAVNPIATEIAKEPVLTNATQHLFDLNLAYIVAAFFFLAAIAHALMATLYRKRYEADLKQGSNKLRWIEFALSDALMLVAIAVLCGVADISLLLTVAALAVGTNLIGLAMELRQVKGKPNWLLFAIGAGAGLVPWIVFAITLAASSAHGNGSIDGFVYWIFGTLFVLFSAFAANIYLMMKKIGPWKEYAYGERMFMIISAVAKTALAWQIFAGILRP